MSDSPPAETTNYQTTRVFRHLAYEVLPRVVGRKPAEFVANFLEHPERFVQRLYRKAVRGVGRADDDTAGKKLRVHFGDFSPNHDFYMIEFPAPASVHYAVVVVDQDARESICYVLSDDLGAGTLVRVIRNGVNWQVGDGPKPDVRGFLEYLQKLHPDFVAR